jgi:hypothetical protein
MFCPETKEKDPRAVWKPWGPISGSVTPERAALGTYPVRTAEDGFFPQEHDELQDDQQAACAS